MASGRRHGNLDLAGLASESHPVARDEPEAIHVRGRDLKNVRLFLIRLVELALTDAASLPAGAAGEQDKGFWASGLQNDCVRDGSTAGTAEGSIKSLLYALGDRAAIVVSLGISAIRRTVVVERLDHARSHFGRDPGVGRFRSCDRSR